MLDISSVDTVRTQTPFPVFALSRASINEHTIPMNNVIEIIETLQILERQTENFRYAIFMRNFVSVSMAIVSVVAKNGGKNVTLDLDGLTALTREALPDEDLRQVMSNELFRAAVRAEHILKQINNGHLAHSSTAKEPDNLVLKRLSLTMASIAKVMIWNLPLWITLSSCITSSWNICAIGEV